MDKDTNKSEEIEEIEKVEMDICKDKIIRCISSDGTVMASAIDSSNIVYIAKKLHHTSNVATVSLGRLITASSMMGAQLKQSNASITLRLNGGGDLGPVIAVADSKGNCRGYVGNPACETTYYDNGKINVAQAIGTNGVLNVLRDYGSGEPYIGQTEIVTGEIAEDITNYYATSEQIPTVCGLGVLLGKEDGEVLLAGGILIQLLPAADENTISQIEKNIANLESVTTMLAKGMTALEICKKALTGFDVEVLDEMEVGYVCTCSRDKVLNAIRLLSDEDIRSLADEKGYAKANCHFCNKNHRFTKGQLEDIIKSKAK